MTNMVMANSIEIGLGSITSHIVPSGTAAKAAYRLKLVGDETLYTKMIFFRTNVENKHDYNSLTLFSGDNCIGTFMTGAAYSQGININSHLQIGGIIGGYLQERRAWDFYNINRPTIVTLDDSELIPVIGLEVRLKAKLAEGVEVINTNIISAIFNASVGIKFDF